MKKKKKKKKRRIFRKWEQPSSGFVFFGSIRKGQKDNPLLDILNVFLMVAVCWLALSSSVCRGFSV
jgi:hypothetical protein